MTFEEWAETDNGKHCLRWAEKGGVNAVDALHFAYGFGQIDGGRATLTLLARDEERERMEFAE